MLMILGSGRSGTTFLGKLFDSHPNTVYRHEPDSVHRNHDIPFLPSADDPLRWRDAVKAYLDKIEGSTAPKVVGHLPFFEKAWRAPLAERLHRSAAVALKAATKMPGVADHYLSVPELGRPGAAPRVVIKSVSSLCRMPLFAEARPETKFIHLLRHPGGVVASLRRGYEAGLMSGDAHLTSIFRLPEIERYPYTFEEMKARPLLDQLAFSWLVHNDKAAEDMRERPQSAANYRQVTYEQVAEHLGDTLPELFAFAGLEVLHQTAEFIAALESASSEGAYFSVMRSPKGSSEKWRGELTPEETATVEEILTHSTANLGQLWG